LTYLYKKKKDDRKKPVFSGRCQLQSAGINSTAYNWSDASLGINLYVMISN
jgi:hypothetical protein